MQVNTCKKEKNSRKEMNMRVKQIKIEFQVTPEIERFVYVYLIETDKGCVLIDSGIAGSEAKIYASEGERAWIENIDLQFRERPIPNFYSLAGKSTFVDYVVKNGDKIKLSDDIYLEVIGTPGHSVDEVSYRVGNIVFIGDAVPVRGDIPIFQNCRML